MDASPVGGKGALSSPEPSLADQARERLLAISQAQTGSGLQDMAKGVVGEKALEKEDQTPALSQPKQKAKEEEADQDEEFRKKLISISYDVASEGLPLPNGVHGASPPVTPGYGQPPA